LISISEMYVANVAISPWAKLIWWVALKIITSASATDA